MEVWGHGPMDRLKVRAEYELLVGLPFGLLWIARAAFGFTQRADGGVPMNLLVAG